MLPKRKLNRLKNYDYSEAGAYFVTILTHEHTDYFGYINDGTMILNKYGEIAKKYWNDIPAHYQDVEIDEYIIMPNHIHGIINIFDENTMSTEPTSVHKIERKNKYGLLSKVVKSFKEAVSKEIRYKLNNNEFKWHRSFYDRIIRNEKEHNNIREYISLNPTKYEFNKNNTFEISDEIFPQ